jgi:tetratricopeptide (TPR) repeat protein
MTTTPRKNRYLAPLLIFALAFGVRLWYLHQLPANPTFDCPLMDAEYHDRWARQLAAGDWVGTEVFFPAPLYPYFLGLLYAAFGPNFTLVRVVQFALGALTCVLLYLLGVRLHSKATGILAGVMAALYGPMIFYDGELLLPVLETVLGMGLLVCVVEGLRRSQHFFAVRGATGPDGAGEEQQSGPVAAPTDTLPGSARWWLLAGLCLGLFAITRPNILAFVPVLAVYLVLALGRRAGGKAVGLFALVAVLCIAPVTIRNWIVGHDFVPISSQAGVNLYIGNNAQSDGTSAVVPGTRATWWGGYRDTINIAEKAAGRKLKPSEVSAYWTRQAVEYAKNDPLGWLKLTGRKLLLFWYGHELPNNEELYAARWYTPLLRPLIWMWGQFRFPFGLIGPLALVGMGLAVWRRNRCLTIPILYVLTYSATVIAFFVCARYRIPVIPPLLLLAAYAIVEGVRLGRERLWRPVPIMAAAFVLLAVPLNHDFFGKGGVSFEKAHLDAGACYERKSDLSAAEREYRAAIAAEPQRIEPRLALASLLTKTKRYTEAECLFEAILSQEPHRWEALYGMGDLRLKQSEPAAALPYFERAVAVDPEGTEAYAAAGTALEALGRQAEAEEMLERGRQGGAGDEMLEHQLAQAAFQRGEFQKAADLARQALNRNPDSAPTQALLAAALLNLGQAQEAAKAAQRALEIQPDNPAALTVLGQLFVQGQQFQQATPLLQRAVEKDPSLPDAWQLLGVSLAMTGDTAGAIKAAEKGIELNPEDEQSRFILAGCYFERKDYAKAAQNARELLKRNPQSERGQKLMQQIARAKAQPARP